jgi:hypothetical protein
MKNRIGEKDYVRIISFGTVIFKNGSAPRDFGINDIMPDYYSHNYKTVDKTEWLNAKYRVVKIMDGHYHVRSIDGKYNFILESSGLTKSNLSILDINYKK